MGTYTVVSALDLLLANNEKFLSQKQGLLPRGEYPNKVSDRNTEVNDLLKKTTEGKPQLEFICSGDVLRQPDGLVNVKDMYDFLHLTEQGYLKSFEPVLKKLKELLNSCNSCPS